jgi:N-acetylmuramoyl-L-alanine amidase
VLGHSDVAPHRKADPGERLDWARLAAAGIGLWPQEAPPAAVDPIEARRLLARIGYALDQPGVTFPQLVTAFHRHFRPARVDGGLDPETMGRLRAVAALLDAAPTPT